MQFAGVLRFVLLAVLALIVVADFDDNSYGSDVDFYENYVKKGGPQGPLRFGKRRGPSGPLRFGKRASLDNVWEYN
ncbi:unnamed protein product [Caenorhabditis bovis]|uniref:Uncharacterized protein n=1 Tax=Caenorhabditis bovis TaxID=2654633 RepID=A0A8S1EXS0_9PELO|nr:unnamed protein product [Caenorhabditis bovis]